VSSATPTIERVNLPETVDEVDVDRPWVTVVWNDPVNLMTYVTWVFQKLFGYSKSKARALMMQVHTEGRAAVSHGSREQMERDVARLQAAGLWATLQRD
jgi:ATP-dependent Clp protease adaptor protein ClpS